jgi:hypothetical protein
MAKMKTFRVRPYMKFSFPVDMLRYDSADFTSEVERAKAARPDFDSADYSVELQSRFEPTVLRWRSFGWRVI